MTLEAPLFVDAEIFEFTQNPAVAKETHNKQSKNISNKRLFDRFLREKNEFKSLLIWLENGAYNNETYNKESVKALLLKAIIELDSAIERQINKVIHHDEFQALEAAWRGLLYTTEQKNGLDKNKKVKVKVLNCSWAALSKDLSRAIEFDQSEFYRLVHSNEYDTSGGEPFGILIGNFQIGSNSNQIYNNHDIETLKMIARVASASFSPFITSLSPHFFGVDHYANLSNTLDITSHFEQTEYTQWRALRNMEESRFLGFTLPNILLRSPYLDDGTRQQAFKFKEKINNPETDCLWGNAAFAFSGIVIRAFCESGWFGQIRGMNAARKDKGVVCDLPISRYETEKYHTNNKPSINLQVGDRLEKELSDNGFIPLSAIKHTDHLVFFSNSSAQQATNYDSKSANVNAKLSSMLQYVLCVSRFAHYIKLLGREKIGSFQTADACQREINNWLNQYTTATESASDEINSRAPLRSANIKVKAIPGKPGHYYSIIQLQPHFQLDQMISTIKLVTELAPRN